MLKKIRIQNFKCLQDTEDMEIRPITFLVGPNSSGKSSVFQAILALKQTVESSDMRSPLILQDYIDLGSYKDVFYKHDTDKDIKIDFENLNLNKWSIAYAIQEDKERPGRIFVKSLEFFDKQLPSIIFSLLGSFFSSGELKIVREKGNSPFIGKLKIVREQGRPYHKIELEGLEDVSEILLNLEKFYLIEPRKTLSMWGKEFSSISRKELLLLFSLSSLLRDKTEELFDHIYHIGPLRDEPERVYSASGAYPQSVGKHGQWTIDIIQYNEEIGDIIKSWLEKFNISIDFALEELKKGSRRYEVVLRDYFTKTKVNLADVGFGTSQILPIIVQGFTSPENSTLLLEQPEIHLHPKAQCVMGDLLVDIAKTSKRLIVETHSDLLIERVCKHILLKDDTKITPEDIIIYYFEPTKEGATVKPITVNENAQFENFPEGFFEERFEEALSRAELME